jgi:hypothetical protein
MGLSFTIAAGRRQRSHSRARVPLTHDHILLPQIRDSPDLDGQVPPPPIYIPQEQGDPGTGFPFLRLLRLTGLRLRYSNPLSHDGTGSTELLVLVTESLHGPHRKRLFHYRVFSRCQEITCPQRCSLATAVVLWPVHAAVTWQWVYMSQYYTEHCPLSQLYTWLFLSVIRRTMDNSYTMKQCSNLLLALASTVILGLEPRREG